MDAMIDLETLGTRPDCVILTIGAVLFDPFSLYTPNSGLYLRLDVDGQIERGRTVDDATIEWWSNQADDVREEALSDGDRVSIETMIQTLNKFLVGVNNIWTQGPVFDITILENIYRQYGWPIPWNFWQIRDCRTLFGVHGDPRVKNKTGLHNALEDCISQASAVQKVYSNLNIKKPAFS